MPRYKWQHRSFLPCTAFVYSLSTKTLRAAFSHPHYLCSPRVGTKSQLDFCFPQKFIMRIHASYYSTSLPVFFLNLGLDDVKNDNKVVVLTHLEAAGF